MRLTIIRDDGVCGIDGFFKTIDLSELPVGVRAVQWDGTTGHVEYYESANSVLTDIAGYQIFIDRWTVATW